MPSRRSYEDACASAHALDLVGERWALLVVRELLLGAKRFTDLRSGLPGISPNVLTQRLEELERSGVVRRVRLAPPAATWVYELTAWGQELEAVIAQLGRWGARSPELFRDVPLGADSLALSMKTMFDAEAAKGFSADVELRIGVERFHAAVQRGRFTIARGPGAACEAVLEAASGTFAALAFAGRSFAAALRSGDLKVEGDKAVAKRFLSVFKLPEPAAAASSS